MICLLVAFFSLLPTVVQAQNSDSIIMQLQTINQAVTTAPCYVSNTLVISNRAMNIFLADKTGYLSESTDLSFYTNYLTLSTAEGKLTINHNFQTATGVDEPIRKLPCIGIWGRMAGRYAATELDKGYETEMGITLGYKWLGRLKTSVADCNQPGSKKMAMAALRTAITSTLANEIQKRSADFETSLNKLTAADVPGQNIDSAKAIMRQYFYVHLKAEYEEVFATRQAVALTETKNFKLISTGWTSIVASIPLIPPRYTIGASLQSSLKEKRPFAFSLQLSHTWLRESAKAGRIFIQLSGEAFLNNAKWSYTLQPITKDQYKALGGIDTNHLATMPNEQLFVGDYQTFITPAIKGQLVYYPPASHMGIAFSIEQNIGKFHTLDSRISIPVVLINKKKLPAANFSFSILFNDIINSLSALQKANTTLFNLSVGIPFSRLMF